MDVAAILKSLADSGLAARIRDSLLLFPLIESTHVLGLALVFVLFYALLTAGK